MKKKIALLLACVMAFGIAVGGTLAWLTDTTEEVKNTFTDSDINITLTETLPVNKTAKMVPGHTIGKDPEVKVETGSEYCWLFVEITKSANFDTYMEYAIADGWQEYTSTNGNVTVVGRKIDTTTEIDSAFSVLDGDVVTVKGSVTKEDMDDLTADTYPTLTFKAYASQLYKNEKNDEFTAAQAWENISDANDNDLPDATESGT